MSRPGWAEVAERAVARAAAAGPAAPDDREDALSAPLWPFLLGVRERIFEDARHRLPAEYADAGRLADSYIAVVRKHLLRIASRTLQAELDKAAEDNGPAGAVAELRTSDGLAALLGEYPVLARLLAVASQRAADAGLELLSRFAADRAAVVTELLGGTDPGPLIAIEPGLGDQHQGGRTVAALVFADGRRVIFKPRDLTLQVQFGSLIDWFSERIPGAKLRSPATVRRPGYGWVEFIASGPLPGPEAAADFFWRVGLLLALLYATQASDMHGENLIAHGAVPVLIDVETLFQPTLPVPRVTSPDPAAQALGDSVLRTALLPHVIADENGVHDYSGIGGDDRDRPPASRPCLDGKAIEPTGYETALITGFRLGYDTIVARKPEFVRLIEQCGDLEVRTVIRPTSGYARLMDESTHPDLLRDARDRERALDVLQAASADHPLWQRATRHELADLWNGDIPLLTSRPSARDIWTSSGLRLPGLLERPGLSCARDAIDAMGEVDRRDQEWVISASMATRRPHGGHRSTDAVPGPVTATAAEPGRLLAAACGLADQIAARAIDRPGEPGRVNWLCLQLVEGTHWMVLPMGAGLADGYLGVGLFLAQLAELTGIDRYADLARRAISPLPALLEGLDGRPELVSAVGCGGLDGLGGISYGLARLSRLLHEPELGQWAVTAAQLGAIADGGVADGSAAAPGWANGSAGYLAAMLSVQAETGSSAVAKLARSCAERLAERIGGSDAPSQPGFAVGAAGVACALTRFGATTSQARYLAPARRAAEYAVARTSPSAAETPGWCRGWAGTLLALSCLPDQADAIESAIDSLAERPVLNDLSLCHGELGIAEVLTALTAAATGRAAARARRHRAGLILGVVNRHTSYCGTPGGLPTPGLLTGLAGIGYGLLRLGFADQVPSALLLQTQPHAATGTPKSSIPLTDNPPAERTGT